MVSKISCRWCIRLLCCRVPAVQGERSSSCIACGFAQAQLGMPLPRLSLKLTSYNTMGVDND
jgi:hypothetical protein